MGVSLPPAQPVPYRIANPAPEEIGSGTGRVVLDSQVTSARGGRANSAEKSVSSVPPALHDVQVDGLTQLTQVARPRSTAERLQGFVGQLRDRSSMPLAGLLEEQTDLKWDILHPCPQRRNLEDDPGEESVELVDDTPATRYRSV
jgi:hypothetical protein